MAEITAAAVNALRQQTSLPLMKVKQALIEAGGDSEKAIEILRSQVGKLMVISIRVLPFSSLKVTVTRNIGGVVLLPPWS